MITKSVESDIDIDEIYSDAEFNCRGDAITPGSVMDLATDIDTNPAGLMTSILIQPYIHEFNKKIKYRIITGHRRYAACKLLKWKAIPSKVLHNLSVSEAKVINITENLKRKDLNIMQEARSLDTMVKLGMSPAGIAKKLDMGTKWVTDRLLLLQLPEDVQNEAAAGIIKAAHVAELVKVQKLSIDKMYEAVRGIKNTNGRRKIIVRIPKAQNATIKREYRKMSDIFRIQDATTSCLGTNLGSKALAYVVGEISALDYLREVKREADLLGIPWSIPQSYIQEDQLDKRKEGMKLHLEAITVG